MKTKLLIMKETNIPTCDFIKAVRFPLIIFVVLIHANFLGLVDNMEDIKLFSVVVKILSEEVASVAVPLFFTISGFLYFNNIKDFSRVLYLQKIKRRIKSLFLPYVVWNLIYIFLFYIVQNLIQSHDGRTKPISNWSILDFFCSFWDVTLINSDNIGISAPICTPLWYVRNLIILVVFVVPIIYFIVSKSLKSALSGGGNFSVVLCM